MADGKPEKVRPAEYVPASAAAPEKATRKAGEKKAGTWEVGKPAPSTVYLDRSTGEVTEKQPERGQVVVREGDTVTDLTLRKLGKA